MDAGLGLEGACWCCIGITGFLCYKINFLNPNGNFCRVIRILIALVAPLGICACIKKVADDEISAACVNLVRQSLHVEGDSLVRSCDEVDYEAIHHGTLVIFTCSILRDHVSKLQGWGAFVNQSTTAAGLRVKAQMKQCVETSTAGKPFYSLEWVDHAVDSTNFVSHEGAMEACGAANNPSWPNEVPLSDSSVVRFPHQWGNRLSPSLGLDVPMNTPYSDFSVPQGWIKVGSLYESQKWQVAHTDGLGHVRVQFFTNGWTPLRKGTRRWGSARHRQHPEQMERKDEEGIKVTVVGQFVNNHFEQWDTPWPCASFSQGGVHVGLNTDAKPTFKTQEKLLFTGHGKAVRASDSIWSVRGACFAFLWALCTCSSGCTGLVQGLNGSSPMGKEEILTYLCAAGCVSACLLTVLLSFGLRSLLGAYWLGCCFILLAATMVLAMVGISLKTMLQMRSNRPETARETLLSSEHQSLAALEETGDKSNGGAELPSKV